MENIGEIENRAFVDHKFMNSYYVHQHAVITINVSLRNVPCLG